MPWAPTYLVDGTPEDVAEFVRAADDDPYVGAYAEAASRSIDDLCGRQFGRLDVAAEFTYPSAYAAYLDTGRWLVLTDDIPAATGITLTVDGVSTAAGVDGYQLWPPNAIAKGTPALGITLPVRPYGDIGITTRFGWLDIPAAVYAATRLQVNRWHFRRESPAGVAGADGDGSSVRLSARLDPDVRTVLSGGSLVRSRMPR